MENGSENLTNGSGESQAEPVQRQDNWSKGEVAIKAEYLLRKPAAAPSYPDDDAAEESTYLDSGAKAKERLDAARESRNDKKSAKKGWNKNDRKKNDGGQNKSRGFGSWGDKIQLCNSRALSPEFSPGECRFGDKCKMCHDIRKYLAEGKLEDLETFGKICPVWNTKGYCGVGWKCRFVGSHSTERETEDGRKELILVDDPERMAKYGLTEENKKEEAGVYNVVPMQVKIELSRKRVDTKDADAYTNWVTNQWGVEAVKRHNKVKVVPETKPDTETNTEHEEKEEGGVRIDTQMDDAPEDGTAGSVNEIEDNRAQFTDPPLFPSEKRRLYYGPETPSLAPLTTQGNLPFRRLCVGLGAQITWSEMAMGLPLINGEKGEWALMRAHESEMAPPRVISNSPVVAGYDNSKDMKFGAQVSANKPWLAYKTASILARYTPKLRAIDLNCGCPIDLVYKQGAGSALLDAPSKLEKMLRGMNALSGEIPITAKIRMGTRDNNPTADSIAKRLVLGGSDAREAGLGPCGIAALTLHGRSRQQRYTRSADWGYIADISALIKSLQKSQDQATDTIREADGRNLPNGGKVYFIGNGDCYSHVDYNDHFANANVDGVMIARGALIKPWIFEEIEHNQYLDKSSSQRLEYIEKFCKFGMEVWGSDEVGLGTTRRFLLEWLSFSCRYVPLGILERLPPKINERPPVYQGRDELETLLGSPDHRDWIKISEMFLGPAHKDFRFTPKHKSNSFEIDAEG
ncbi:tRNA-dihydrouridine synthase-like protein 3 [Tothia fuscella]|uniref:tRNA-dihydrouridine(47) synthase [NAD(P)(+)] n=1 Tax=Tothia fuscella TaxID=1048955 RepID=A0A9P4TXC1_9PEZI|nr:tRNA-dihydrouridine synthase-like protein 3 [Tothia fuscella]